MAALATAALIFCLATTATHLVTVALALSRVRLGRRSSGLVPGPVSVVRPVCGLDYFDEQTLRSTFELEETGKYEIIFCAARPDDPAVTLVRRLIAEHPQI